MGLATSLLELPHVTAATLVLGDGVVSDDFLDIKVGCLQNLFISNEYRYIRPALPFTQEGISRHVITRATSVNDDIRRLMAGGELVVLRPGELFRQERTCILVQGSLEPYAWPRQVSEDGLLNRSALP